jgi:AcrR family transcriptional regulator
MNTAVAPVKRQTYHHEMKVSPRSSARTNQKERTRAALVEAARALLRAGTPPTVAEAAEQARVSRATAYRYFPTHDALLIEAGNITPATEPVEDLVQNLPSDDPEERLRSVLDRFIPIIFAEEAAMRAALRTYQDTWLANRARGEQALPVREGRRMRWLDKVLEPVRRDLTEAQLRRLRNALALVLSPDALVVLKDVCGVQGEKEALEVLRWTGSALIRAGLAEAKSRARRSRG